MALGTINDKFRFIAVQVPGTAFSTQLLAPRRMVDSGDGVDIVGRAREDEEPSEC